MGIPPPSRQAILTSRRGAPFSSQRDRRQRSVTQNRQPSAGHTLNGCCPTRASLTGHDLQIYRTRLPWHRLACQVPKFNHNPDLVVRRSCSAIQNARIRLLFQNILININEFYADLVHPFQPISAYHETRTLIVAGGEIQDDPKDYLATLSPEFLYCSGNRFNLRIQSIKLFADVRSTGPFFIDFPGGLASDLTSRRSMEASARLGSRFARCT